MLKEERHDFILNEVRIRNRVLLSDLARQLNVSEDTVRRDLTELHNQGKLKKVHGGAVAKSFTPFSFHQEEIYDHQNKQIIARKAARLLKKDMVVLITGGTTNLELVTQIPEDLHLTFFTPSLQVAMQLGQLPHVDTILLGGKVATDAQVTFGIDTLKTLSQTQADICFLGTGHLDPVNGVSEFDWEVVQLKKAMIDSSRKIVLLTLSAKLNSTQRYKICDVNQIHTLITELDPSHPALAQFQAVGLEIL
jgi:DeoR/GlpR family transcriptional regulator of sugar metabolism